MDSWSVLAAILSPSFLELIERKARTFARKRGFAADEVDDLKQEFLIALIRAAPKYDPARGTPEAFAHVVLESCGGMIARSRRLQKNAPPTQAISLDSPESLFPGGSSNLCMVLTIWDKARRRGTAAIEESDELRHRRQVEAAMEALPTEERDVARALQCNSIRDAARILGKSRTYICEVKKCIAKRWRGSDLDPT